MKDFAKKFYNSSGWKKCRAAYIAERRMIDGGLCEKCKQRTGYIVHHITPLTPENINDPDISLSFMNLRYDCKPCHDEEEDHFVKRKAPVCSFDRNGQPIDLRSSDP